MRVINRKFGRDGSSPYATGASHAVKIGYDKREFLTGKALADAKHPLPGKLAGFLICRDSIDAAGRLVVDHVAMQKIGEQYTPEAIAKAKKMELKAPEGLLPTVLHFVIGENAVRLGETWSFPGTVSEAYECWTGEGKYCSGDGERAKRKQGNGAQVEIDCVPVGRAGADPSTFCQHSVKKACHGHSRLTLCLFEPNDKGEPEPLSESLGFTARFRFDTSSEYGAMGFFQALDRAADRVQGYLLRLTGTLSFSIKRRRTGDAKFSIGIVGNVLLAIDEDSICKREAEIREHEEKMRRLRIEERRALALPEPEEPIDEAEEVPPSPPSLVVEPDPEPKPEPKSEPKEEPEFEPADLETEADEPEIELRVAQADDYTLADSLSAFADDKFSAYAWFDYENDGTTARHAVPNEDWFFNQPEGSRKDLFRRAKLREICLRLEASEPGFAVLTPTERSVAP